MTIDRAKSHILTEKSAGVWLFFFTEGKMYRETRNYENIQIMRFPGEGKYDIPAIDQTQFEQADFIGFNYAKSEKHPENKAVHFFLDDYQFNRVWTYPDRYITFTEKRR